MNRILVTGATGAVGANVVRELRDRGATVRAFVRDAARGATVLGTDIDLAVGDLDDTVSIRAALEGVDRLFLACANSPRQVSRECAVIDAAAAAGVSRIVKLSALGAAVGSPLPAFDWHGRIDAHLRASPVPAVVLHPTFFMSNVLLSADALRLERVVVAPAEDGGVAMIDPRDVAAVAAVALTTDGYDGQTLDLTGREAVTFHDVARDLSTATGVDVTFVDVPPGAAKQAFIEAGMPDWLVTHLTGVFELLRQGALEPTTDVVRTVTGRSPRTFADFASDHPAVVAM